MHTSICILDGLLPVFSYCCIRSAARLPLERKWRQNRAQHDCHVSNVLVIGGRPKAAQEHWFGGRPKAALLDVSGGHVYGGRPRVALTYSLLIFEPAFGKSTASSTQFKRSLLAATQQKTFVFRFHLARLWRALISSIYI